MSQNFALAGRYVKPYHKDLELWLNDFTFNTLITCAKVVALQQVLNIFMFACSFTLFKFLS